MAMASIDGPEEILRNNQNSLKFYPNDNWGLDFYFQTFSKMYISDVLLMEEYSIFPGAYMYRNHPIYKVDIIGIVRKVDQNSKCFMYEIDDGTGVISCSCWKVSYSEKYHGDVQTNIHHLPSVLQSKLNEMICKTNQFEGYSLGNLVHVRGKIDVFRNKRQIVAVNHSLVTDPMTEVYRMTELPKLYKMKYDKSFEMPWKIAKELRKDSKTDSCSFKSSEITEIKRKLCEYFQTSKIEEVNASNVSQIEILQPYLETITNSDIKLKCLESVLISLEEDGCLCKRIDSPNVYEVLCGDSDLDKAILWILREECSKEKFVNKGCHYLHILDMLHRTYQYSHVKKQSVTYCLEKLEEQSEIIRATHCHYMLLS